MPKQPMFPTDEEKSRFRQLGYELDSHGRPLHPWRDRLPHLAEGKGFFYHWGPNYTVDPVVISQTTTPRLLLIQRGDTGRWAFPGGFLETNEDIHTAGLRELQEETGLAQVDSSGRVVYTGVVNDRRATLHAWPETSAILWRTHTAYPVQAGDDAEHAEWVPLCHARTLLADSSHGDILAEAIKTHGSLHEKVEYYADQSIIRDAQGGHMAYSRVIISPPEGVPIFVKHHNKNTITDDIRADHLRRYLKKEYAVYKHLETHGVPVPNDVMLIDDHTLLMEALDPNSGWYWRAPGASHKREAYIEDILRSLTTVASTPPVDTADIASSYTTLHQEGWNVYPDHQQMIREKLAASQIDGSNELIAALDTIYARYSAQHPPELTAFCHHDFRQSNVAWHPAHGTKIVDWSWADRGPRLADTTSFLIDLYKSGHEISRYQEYVDEYHALVLIGFWLEHSIWPPAPSNHLVREQQLASAIAAFRLLEEIRQTSVPEKTAS
ncbi:phosphotransferase [Candidatus Saccharibacteria bacterium]|nr:MAG: phosphotransferase [Candidatus Saccharibacteria bacterium]